MHEQDPELRSNLKVRCQICHEKFECIFPEAELDRLLDHDARRLSALRKDALITQFDVQCQTCQKMITVEVPAEVMLKLLEARIQQREILTALDKIEGNGESGGETVEAAPLEEVIEAGETTTVEFKATLRTNLHTQQHDPRIELSWLKTVAGFVNSRGGTLIVAVRDDGTALGIEEDGFANEDKFSLHLTNVVKERIGPAQMMYVHPRFDEYEGSACALCNARPAGHRCS